MCGLQKKVLRQLCQKQNRQWFICIYTRCGYFYCIIYHASYVFMMIFRVEENSSRCSVSNSSIFFPQIENKAATKTRTRTTKKQQQQCLFLINNDMKLSRPSILALKLYCYIVRRYVPFRSLGYCVWIIISAIYPISYNVKPSQIFYFYSDHIDKLDIHPKKQCRKYYF